jgi:hypothetical protein
MPTSKTSISKKDQEKNEKLKRKLSLVLIFITIIVLSFVTYYRFQNIKFPENYSELDQNFNFDELKKIITQGDIITQEKDNSIKNTFSFAEEKIKIKYPKSWQITDEETLSSLNDDSFEGKAKLLLLAYDSVFSSEGSIFLSIQEISFDEKKSFDEFLEILSKEYEKKDLSSEIEREDVSNNVIIVNSILTKGDGSVFKSKEKIISFENKMYLVDIICPNNSWNKNETLFKEIIDSVEVLFDYEIPLDDEELII